jgi:uncharacterized protein (TIGR02284 family)
MITNDDTTLLVLNHLILVGNDAERGYQLAADQVKVPELVKLFEGFARQRKKFLLELEERVRVLRATPPARGTVAGALHRGWMGLTTALESSEAHTVLAECERGEDASVKAYADALREADVDGQTRQLIQQQYEQVQAAHDRVRQLRDSATYAPRQAVR